MTTNDMGAVNEQILAETRNLAEAYAIKFDGDPEGELRAWLHIAARREAMVSDIYGRAERSYRLPEPHVPAGKVAWEAFTLIWQHEEVHTRFIEVRLKDGVLQARALSAEVMIWLGTVEGKLLAALTGRLGLRQLLSKLAVRLGALVAPEAVPELALALAELDPREFFLLCAALETTARQCYARMEALAEQLAEARPGSLQLENLARELCLKRLDETFHEQAFEEMAGWVVGGRLDPSLSAETCAHRIARLLPRGARAPDDPDSPYVLTDGGLGKLFRRLGPSIIVQSSAQPAP